MSIGIVCPACGKTLRADERLVGKQIRCRSCNHVFVAASDLSHDALDEPPALEPDFGTNNQGGKAIASLVLGIFGLIGWCLPILGVPITVVGLVLGFVAQKCARYQGMAIAGIVLNTIGLVLSVANAAIGAYLAATGQHPLFR